MSAGRQVLLVRWPEGVPVAADFALAGMPVPEPGPGEALVRVTHLSIDPLPRTRMQPAPPMGRPMALGACVEGRGVGRVLASQAPGLAAGDLVTGELGWRTHAALPAAALARVEGGPPHAHLNALGPTGLAALLAVEEVQPAPGQTLVIAPAAGAVGSLACQMAQLIEPTVRIWGTARGARQAAFLRELGVEPLDPDAPDWPDLPPVDILIDGVGGAFHDRMLERLAPRARILLLGFIAGYGEAGPPRYGSAAPILLRRATMQGFLLADHAARFAGARARIAAWLAAGALRPAETLHPGLAAAPAAFAGLFAPDPAPGKQIVVVEEPEA